MGYLLSTCLQVFKSIDRVSGITILFTKLSIRSVRYVSKSIPKVQVVKYVSINYAYVKPYTYARVSWKYWYPIHTQY